MDSRLRDLERKAKQGDAEAHAQLQRERCRIEGHDPGKRGDVISAGEGKAYYKIWDACLRCEAPLDLSHMPIGEVMNLPTRWSSGVGTNLVIVPNPNDSE